MIAIVLLLGAVFAYWLIYKPEYVAVILFVLVIANLNFDISALPLNTRAIVTLALFGRIIINKPVPNEYPRFLETPSSKILLIFLFYIVMVSFSQGLFTIELLKLDISTVMSTFFVYYYYVRDRNPNILKAAVILSGLVCFADLLYTYAFFGTFPVQRVSDLITGAPTDPTGLEYGENNHNFYGQICGMAFVYLFTDFIQSKKANLLSMLLLPVMFLGVLMSTSRSALMGMILVFLLVIMKGITDKEQMRRVYKVGTFSIVTIAAAIVLFMMLKDYLHLDADFLNSITERLIDEPLAVFRKAMGYNYNVNNLDSMEWRGEAAADAFGEYLRLPLSDQVFGIGNGGFLARDLGHGLNPHNGILLIVIEDGLIGFLIYLVIILGLYLNSLILNNVSPSLAVLTFIIVYGLGQNKELTSITTFLFVFTAVAENQVISVDRRKAREEKKRLKRMQLHSV